jgi:hypothetical protein
MVLVTGYLNGTNVYGESGEYIFYKHDSWMKNLWCTVLNCLVVLLWRKKSITYAVVFFFDEQFKYVSILIFKYVALRDKIRVDESLGIYLEMTNKIVSNTEAENETIYLRYGVYEK